MERIVSQKALLWYGSWFRKNTGQQIIPAAVNLIMRIDFLRSISINIDKTIRIQNECLKLG